MLDQMGQSITVSAPGSRCDNKDSHDMNKLVKLLVIASIRVRVGGGGAHCDGSIWWIEDLV